MNKHLLLIYFLLFSCSPETIHKIEVENNIDYKKLSYETMQECNMYNSFAYENFDNKDYRSTVDNYKYMIELGCGDKFAEYIFIKMGRSYIELDKSDSANIIFKQGLKYISNNEDLLTIAAWNAGKINLINEQITYLQMLLDINTENIKAYDQLSDVYRENNMYDEQINILNEWLEIDITSKKANAEKKAAFKALGKDELDVDKERWLANPSNVHYGLDYVKGLMNKGLDSEVINTCNSLIVYDKYNTEVLMLKAEAHLNLYEDDLALEAYLNIDQINPNDFNIAIELSKIYINKEQYDKALNWANNAVSSSGEIGDALFQRAEVFYSIAESCTGDALNFWDKIVFEIAWEDYNSAVNAGYSRAKMRADFLYENNITKTGDWFMRPEDEMEVKPMGECYVWINRSIKRK